VVGEPVHAAGGDDDGLARAGDDAPEAEAELHLALGRVAGRLQERDALAADGFWMICPV
jgi:hypothetical protein